MSLTETTYQFIRNNRLIPPGSILVVGVSGGADSLALLHILCRIRHRLRCQLHAATLDHGLRGAAGAADAAFVVQTCAAWGIPVSSGQVDTRAQASGQGIEAAARRARYDFLAQTARAVGAAHIATAHHANDQAETVLMHLLRGAGTAGLSGMAASLPLPDQPDLTLIRPLLTATRAQIDAYCQQYNLQPRHDDTNTDTDYLRNRLRLEILPTLRAINPQIDLALLQLADTAATDSDYIGQQLAQIMAAHGTAAAGRISINRRAFKGLHPALQRRWVYHAVQSLGQADAGYSHITRATQVGRGGRVGALALLPGRLRLRVGYDALVIEAEDSLPDFDGPLLASGTNIALHVPGDVALPGGWILRLSHTPLSHTAQALAIQPDQALWLRTPRPGDDFAPLGLNGHRQKLRKWLINRKVPRLVRDYIPLLVVDYQIAAIFLGTHWYVGHHFAVSPTPQHVIYALFTHPTINT